MKREFAVFVKSASILNQGMGEIKTSNNERHAKKVRNKTYLNLVKVLLDQLENDQKVDLRNKLG